MYAKAILGLVGVAAVALVVVPTLFSIFHDLGNILRTALGS